MNIGSVKMRYKNNNFMGGKSNEIKIKSDAVSFQSLGPYYFINSLSDN